MSVRTLPALVQQLRSLTARSDEELLADYLARRSDEAFAAFLRGVAYRLAVRARKRQVRPLPPGVGAGAAVSVDDLAWRDMLGILDGELRQLPEQYRAPLVLCYLEGRTQDEAARQIG